MVTTKPFSKIWNNSLSWVILSSNQNFVELCKHFGRRDEEADRNGCFHWTLISTSLKLNCWAWLHELISISQYATTYLNPQNLTWITNFRNRKFYYLGAHSKHILIILTVDSQNFRKLQEWFSEFERDEKMTQKRKSNRLLINRWNFGWLRILRAQKSISWARDITNDAALYLEHKKTSKCSLKAKNRSNLTPITLMLLCLQTHGKVM